MTESKIDRTDEKSVAEYDEELHNILSEVDDKEKYKDFFNYCLKHLNTNESVKKIFLDYIDFIKTL